MATISVMTCEELKRIVDSFAQGEQIIIIQAEARGATGSSRAGARKAPRGRRKTSKAPRSRR